MTFERSQIRTTWNLGGLLERIDSRTLTFDELQVFVVANPPPARRVYRTSAGVLPALAKSASFAITLTPRMSIL